MGAILFKVHNIYLYRFYIMFWNKFTAVQCSVTIFSCVVINLDDKVLVEKSRRIIHSAGNYIVLKLVSDPESIKKKNPYKKQVIGKKNESSAFGCSSKNKCLDPLQKFRWA